MSKTLYTQTLPTDLAEKIRRIPSAEGLEAFISQPYQLNSGYGQQATEWIEATKADQEHDRWSLRRYRILGPVNGEESVMQFETAAQNICFFDALHYCANKQEARRINEDTLSENIDLSFLYPDLITVKMAADKSCQVFDMTSGLPIPCAEGKILVENGVCNVGAMITAKKTADIPLLVTNEETPYAITLYESSDFLPKIAQQNPDMTGADDTSSIIATTKSREKLLKTFETMNKGTKHLVGTTELKSQGRDFELLDEESKDKIFSSDGFFVTVVMHGLGLMIGAIPALIFSQPLLVLSPIAFVYGWIIRDKRAGLHAHSIKALKKEVAKLESSPYKQALEKFTITAEANGYFANAAHLLEAKSPLSTKNLKKGLKLIEKGCQAAGASAEETNCLKDAFSRHSFPQPDHFVTKTREAFNDVVAARDAYFDAYASQADFSKEMKEKMQENWPKTLKLQ